MFIAVELFLKYRLKVDTLWLTSVKTLKLDLHTLVERSLEMISMVLNFVVIRSRKADELYLMLNTHMVREVPTHRVIHQWLPRVYRRMGR